MNEAFPSWLTKQMIKETKGLNLDTYLMALEGWRRGLSLTFYYDPTQVTDLKITDSNPIGKAFSLKSNKSNMTYYFYRSLGNKVSNEAIDLTYDRQQTKTHLKKSDVLSLNGVVFHKDTDNSKIVKLVDNLGYPLVIKSKYNNPGEISYSNIRNEAELLEAIAFIREKEDYDEILVESYLRGENYRIYVIGDSVVAATKRIPAHVIGDGIHTIKELIEEKNAQRTENYYLKQHVIKIDDHLLYYLDKNNVTPESIPMDGEMVQLNGECNISLGGDPIDVTETLSENIKDQAIKAVKAIPGLSHGGVDLIVHEDQIFVSEINATADIRMHVFPLEGKSRNVPEHIMDYYFPETEGQAKDRTRIYFDYADIHEVLMNKFAQEMTLTDAPDGKLYTARYIISGKVQKVGYRVWIRKQAIKKGLHGYTRNLSNGRVVVVVGSHDKKAVENFRKTCSKGPAKAKVKSVKELEWKSPIKLGFEIRKTK